jgi:hypothetical protein
MMVIFLTGLVSMILMRTLRKDYARYARDDDDAEDVRSIQVIFVDYSSATLEKNLDGSKFTVMFSVLHHTLFFSLPWLEQDTNWLF